jgi:hypothetical protein
VHSRHDSRHRRAHRWPPGQCASGSRPVRGAYVCCPESLAVQCGDLRRPSTEEPGGFPRGFGPVGESPNTANKNTRKDEHPKSMPSGKQDFPVHSLCLAQGSVDTRDNQRFSMRGKACSWRGSRSKYQCRRQYRCSFGRCLRQHSFIQADEHPCGHPSGPVWDRCQHRSLFHPQACQISYGPTQPSLSVAGSVGECLTDTATDGTHTHAQACVGDRGTSRDASVREQHARPHIRCHPALVQLAFSHSFE